MKKKVFSIFLIFISIVMFAAVASAAQMTKIGTGHDPAIYGNMVTWSEDNGSIHIYDLTAKEGTTISSSSSSHPAIYGNKIVWHDESSGTPKLTVYDMPSGNRSYIIQNVDSTSIPKIYGNRIVWGSNGNVYLFDVSSSTQTQIAEGSNPDIYDTKIVYSAAGRENKDIFMYDITTKKIELISPESSDLSSPYIYGNKVIWANSRTRMGFIQMYDLVTKKAMDVTSDNTYSGDPNKPDAGDDTGTHIALYGDKIVYAKISHDQFGDVGVYVYNVSTGQSTPVINYPVALNTAGVYTTPDVYDDTVVWGFDNPSWLDNTIDDIYICNLTATAATATVPQPPVADFISNVTSGDAPLSVAFIDTSTGTPALWYWDFGDRTNSTERNPMHTYLSAGNYTVRLTVSNENGTDSKLATISTSKKLIPVLPAVNFNSNVTSGYVPLTVQFNDSSYNATGWYWDFGDGFASTEQNPKHIYFKAGAFTVNLTASNGNGTDSKLATLTLLKHPVYAYITNYGSNTTSVIDTATNTVIATVNVGINPRGVGVSMDGSKVYVTNNESNTVSVIDTATNIVIATVPVGYSPFGVAVSPDGTKVYVANNEENTTSVIDTATNTVVATIPVEVYPSGIAVSPDGTKVYVASSAVHTVSSADLENSTYSSIVSVIDTATNTVIDSVSVGAGSIGIAFGPDGKKAYVTNGYENTVSVIDTENNTEIDTVPVGKRPWGIAVSPDGAKVYVANFDDNTISVIDTATNSILSTVPVGIYPSGISFTPDGTKAYVTNTGSNNVYVIDTATNTIISAVNVGNTPFTIGQFIKQSVIPLANFSSNVTRGYAPLSVQFTDLSKNALEWRWEFGDGGTSMEQNPAHTYSAIGTYNVNLTVINAKGVTSKTGTVTVLEDSSSNGGSSSGDGSSGGSSHSSSGGGGAGGSPEPQSNVEIKELSQTFIVSGKAVKFDFPQKATPVVYVGFDSMKTAGKTTTISEMLKGKSTLVSGLPSDEVYKYLNIWVGNGGYATEKNIENAVVCFKVEKSWIKNKSIDQSSITLNRYCDNKWSQLPTNLSEEDDKYLYFTAKTPGFSPFAITGKSTAGTAGTQPISENKTQQAVDDTQTKPNAGNAIANVRQTPEQMQSSNTSEKRSIKAPGFEVASGIICLLCVYLYKRR